jgi:hypothetical protein
MLRLTEPRSFGCGSAALWSNWRFWGQIFRKRKSVTLFAGVFVPGDVVAGAAGNQKIQVAVLIQFEGADVAGLLAGGDKMIREVSLAIVLEPPSLLVTVSAGGGVEITIAIQIDDNEGMGFLVCGGIPSTQSKPPSVPLLPPIIHSH